LSLACNPEREGKAMGSAALARTQADRPGVEPSDEQLVGFAKAGDDEATRRVLVRYRQFRADEGQLILHCGGDGDDLIQEGYIGLYKAIRDYEYGRNTSFRSFAELCVTRQIITAIKTASRQKHVPLNTYLSFSHSPSSSDYESRTWRHHPLGTASDPVQQVISSEEVVSLTDCLVRLLSPLESLVLKFYLEGNSYEAIANT